MGNPVTWASVVIGIAIPPNATGAVSATSAKVTAFIGLRPTPTSITEQIAIGVPKPRERLEQRTEAEGDHDHLDTLVVGYRGERPAQHGEIPRLLRHVKDP